MINFISSIMSPDGTTITKLKYKNKEYAGIARLHPKDEEKKSKFAGGEISEYRAMIKILKEIRREEKEKCEECRKFVTACSQYKNFDKESPTAKAIFKQLNKRIKKVNNLTDKINYFQYEIYKIITGREIIYKKYIKEKAKKDN